jgi:putative DNA primase/helicase
MLPLDLDKIPSELKVRPQWVVWRQEEREGKLTKVPYRPQNPKKKADTTAPDTWGTFEQAVSVAQTNGFHGIGYVFSPQDDYAGVDLDKCRDRETGEIEPWARANIGRLQSYTEESPSGTGLHILVKGKVPTGGNKKGKVEMYSQGRYFTMTGQHLEGSPATIEARQTELEGLHRDIFGRSSEESKQDSGRSSKPPPSGTSDDDLLDKITKSKNGEKFRALWEYDEDSRGWLKYRYSYSSQSEADLALCSILAFWTGKDPTVIDRIFRRSNLMRPKWDEYRGEQTYGEMTIATAIAGTKEIWKGGKRKRQGKQEKGKQEQEKDFVSFCASGYDKSTIIKQLSLANEAKFYPQIYINVIRQYYKLIYCAEDFYEYQNGVYIRREVKTIESYVKELFGEKPRRSKIDEIVKLLAIDCHIETEALNNSKNNYLDLKNGLFDLANFKLISHTPDYISIIQLPVNYDPKATCPLWKKTLRTSLPEDRALHDVLQEWAGYCVTQDVKHEKAMIFDGEGANGKGVVGDTIAAMLGKDNCSAVHLADLDRGAQRASLFGKLLNFASEISSKEIVSDSYFKSIVSGDLITGEAKYKNPFTFRPFCKMMFATNNLPRVNDKSYGFYRKLIIIPFNQKFVDSNGQGPRKDKKRRAKLLKEIDGIFLWALQGLKRLEKRGFFTEPKVILGKIEEYRRQNNPIIQFVEECCELKEGQIEVKTAYKTYGEWALQFGFQTMNDVNFSKTLRKEYPQIVPDKIDGTRIFKGMILSKTGNGLLNMAFRREEKRLAQRVNESQ